MSNDSGKHHRKSIRLREYDYSSPGWYFVTICTKDRKRIFGKVENEEIILNRWGEMVQEEWKRTEMVRENVKLDEFIVMPNHIHGIIRITYQIVGIDGHQSLRDKSDMFTQRHRYGPQSNNLFAIIRGFKGSVTKKVNIYLGNSKGGTIWQSRFYDHIIRDEDELNRIREYIRHNPQKWHEDLENSEFKKKPFDARTQEFHEETI